MAEAVGGPTLFHKDETMEMAMLANGAMADLAVASAVFASNAQSGARRLE
ncbi:hypothetical protein [Cupriavidus taiwanensis]|nr:hypothetical protein [Cupriavidus taiwanensis]